MAKGKYQKWLEPEGLTLIEGWARDGLTDEQIAKNMGVAYSTFRDWKSKYPALSAPLKKGKEVVDYQVENALLNCALDGNTTAQIFWLKNRRPDKWRDKQLGTDYFEVSYHSGARPTHQVWQGRVYSRSQLESVCGLGTVTGLCGANCYHSYSPFIPGVDIRTYTDEQLDKMNAEENTPAEYNGKQYTKYEAAQRQRALERTMRANRQEIALLEAGGADEDAITAANARYRKNQDEYVKFSKAMNLPQQWDRVTAGGTRDLKITKAKTNMRAVNSGTKTVAKSGESGIIREKSAKPITEITDNAINRVPKLEISGYTDEQCTAIQEQHKELLRFARDNNDGKEVAFVFNKALKKQFDIKGTDKDIDFGNGLRGKDLFVMHNHPRSSSYSTTDIEFFAANNSVKAFSIAKNDGRIEIIVKGDNFDLSNFKLEYDRLHKKW